MPKYDNFHSIAQVLNGEKRITNVSGLDLKSTQLIYLFQGVPGSVFDILGSEGGGEVVTSRTEISSVLALSRERIRSQDIK